MSIRLLNQRCKCGSPLAHIEVCFRKGTHGDDPRSMHEIVCSGCNKKFFEQEHYPSWFPSEQLLKDISEKCK